MQERTEVVLVNVSSGCSTQINLSEVLFFIFRNKYLLLHYLYNLSRRPKGIQPMGLSYTKHIAKINLFLQI